LLRWSSELNRITRASAPVSWQRRGLARTVPWWQRIRGALSGAIGLIGIAGWALYDALGLWRIQVGVAIGML
jgi:hypothetical protein